MRNLHHLLLVVLGLGLAPGLAHAGSTITVQGVLRDSNGDLIQDYSPSGGIKAVFFHATRCAAIVNGDADLLGCAPVGGEVVNSFRIKAGAFALSLEPTSATLTQMTAASTGWYVKIRGVFAPGAPAGEFLIPLDSVPFAKTAEVAAGVGATAATGNSVIAAINATAPGDTKINADRLTIDGSSIASGTIGGSTAISTSGTIASGAVTSSGTVTGNAVVASGLGSATTPAYAFSGDPNTGIYSAGADTLNLVTGGTSRLSVSSTGVVAASGNVTVAGTLVATGKVTANGQPDFNTLASNDVVTKKVLTQMAPNFFKSKTFSLNSAAWANLNTTSYTADGTDAIRRLYGTNAAGGSVTTYVGGIGALRGRLGNVKSTYQWGSTDFASKFRIYVEFVGVIGRTDFTTDSFGAAFGTHMAYEVTASGLTQLMETSTSTTQNYLVGFKVVAGAVTLWVKNGTAAATSSATIATLTDAVDIGSFVMEVDAGTLRLYRNNVLLGSMTGAPSTLVAGPSTVGVGMQSTATTTRELILQTAAIAWE